MGGSETGPARVPGATGVPGATIVIDQHLVPAGGAKPSEDICVIDERPGVGICFLAVIDGATDECGITSNGRPPGTATRAYIDRQSFTPAGVDRTRDP